MTYSSEMHARSRPLFEPQSDEVRAYNMARMMQTVKYLNDHELNGMKKYLVGDAFTVADAYCYVILTWSSLLKYSLSDYPAVKSYFEGIQQLDFIQKAQAEMTANGKLAGYGK